MGTIYLVNILNNSKYTWMNVTIILRPFMLIIILEYTCNMVVNKHWKFIFLIFNTPNYII
jgi:hypothetical protein